MTSISELLKNTEGAHITINVGLPDLRQWHKEIVESNLKELQQVKEALSGEEYYTAPETIKKLGVKARSTLLRWEKRRYLLPVRIGGQVRYRKSDIDKILGQMAGVNNK
jgi:predicted DNA-binding transcriptional regulator AlpA